MKLHPGILGSAILVAVLGASLRASAASFVWWLPAAADETWTNQPLDKIRTAAEKDDPAALYYLGRAYWAGQQVAPNLKEAFQWTLRSAERGYAPAQAMTALFYFDGAGIPMNRTEGFGWATQAVVQSNIQAMSILGWAYYSGAGTARDAAKARDWLLRAAEGGAVLAPLHLAEFYLKGEGGTAQRTNYVEALQWSERAASNGYLRSAITAAELLESGRGSPPDEARALRWLRFAVDQGSPDAMDKLYEYYARGLAEPRHAYEEPIWLLRKAAVTRAMTFQREGPQGWSLGPSWSLIYGCRELWNRYHFGIGTRRDHVAAAEWMWIAYQEEKRRADSGRAPFAITKPVPHPFDTILYSNAPPASADERAWREAVRLVRDALDEGLPEAWMQIGESYRDGSKWTPRQPQMARSWLARAVEMNHPPARQALQDLEAALAPAELERAKMLWVPSVPTRSRR